MELSIISWKLLALKKVQRRDTKFVHVFQLEPSIYAEIFYIWTTKFAFVKFILHINSLGSSIFSTETIIPSWSVQRGPLCSILSDPSLDHSANLSTLPKLCAQKVILQIFHCWNCTISRHFSHLLVYQICFLLWHHCHSWGFQLFLLHYKRNNVRLQCL